MPTLFASTLPKPHKPTLKPKLCQRACKANAEKKLFLKNFLTLQKNKKRNAQPTRQ
jgi:hypothetical protein